MSKRDLAGDVAALEQYALDNYGSGGHWVYETFSDLDYAEVLRECGSLEVAKRALKRDWELCLQRERECSWGE